MAGGAGLLLAFLLLWVGAAPPGAAPPVKQIGKSSKSANRQKELDVKKFYLSKTLWFNVLALLVMIANGFGYADFKGDAHLTEYAFVIVTLLNVGLRLATSKGITFGQVKAQVR
jgi:hypothetical protein